MTRTDPQPCRVCQAPADKRIEASGFGAARPLICGVCGAEWKKGRTPAGGVTE